MSGRSFIVCGVLLIVGGVVCWVFPLFHIHPLGATATVAEGLPASPHRSRPTDPAAYVSDLWDGPLRTGEGATEITRLWDAFDRNMPKAQSQYGRQAGLGGAWHFCVRGRGRVESVENGRVVLGVADNRRDACLELGAVVDNTVREAFGVSASDFANSQSFNAISSELNARVEQEVIAPNRERFELGTVVEFVGCAKVGGRSDLDPLCLIPIQLNLPDTGRGDRNSAATAVGGPSP